MHGHFTSYPTVTCFDKLIWQVWIALVLFEKAFIVDCLKYVQCTSKSQFAVGVAPQEASTSNKNL